MENERQICELLSNINDRLMQIHLTLTTIGVGVFDNGTMDQNVRNQFMQTNLETTKSLKAALAALQEKETNESL